MFVLLQSLSALKRFSLTVDGWQGYGVAGEFGTKATAGGRRKNAAEIVQLPDVSLDFVEAAIQDSLAQVSGGLVVRNRREADLDKSNARSIRSIRDNLSNLLKCRISCNT